MSALRQNGPSVRVRFEPNSEMRCFSCRDRKKVSALKRPPEAGVRATRFSWRYADAVSPRPANIQGQTSEAIETNCAKMCCSDDGRMRGKSPMARSGEASYVNGSGLMVDGASSPRRQWRIPKVALDFLLRPARMTSAPAFRYQAFYKTGKNSPATANRAAREGADMAVGSWPLQCLFCEEFTLSRAEAAADAGSAGGNTKQDARYKRVAHAGNVR